MEIKLKKEKSLLTIFCIMKLMMKLLIKHGILLKFRLNRDFMIESGMILKSLFKKGTHGKQTTPYSKTLNLIPNTKWEDALKKIGMIQK